MELKNGKRNGNGIVTGEESMKTGKPATSALIMEQADKLKNEKNGKKGEQKAKKTAAKKKAVIKKGTAAKKEVPAQKTDGKRCPKCGLVNAPGRVTCLKCHEKLFQKGNKNGSGKDAATKKVSGGNGEPREGSITEHIVKIVLKHPDGLSMKEILAKLNTTKTYYNTCRKLEKRGLIKKVEDKERGSIFKPAK